MRILAALFFLFFSTSSMSSEILIKSHNPVSKRAAILEDDQRAAYLYLSKPRTLQPEADAIVYMRIAPIGREEWEAIRRAKGTPLLLKELASEQAVIDNPDEAALSFRWAHDGNAVAVLMHGAPLAFISMAERFGYSKAVSVSSPLANAWDQAKYESLFGE